VTDKDIQITTLALQKSLIERGVPLEDIQKELKKQVDTFALVTNAWKEGINNGK